MSESTNSNIEFSMIRGALIVLLVSIAIAALMIWFSYYFRGEMFAEYSKHKTQFQNISQRYLAVDQEEKNIRDFYPSYAALYEIGIIGREHRLNWIETLRNLGQEIQIPSVGYQINSQTEYDNRFPVTQGSFKVYVSSMDLNLQLLHEGDLVNLMQKLNENANGIYSIRSCELVRKNDVIKRSTTTSNVDAKCELEWFNIKKSDGTELSI